MKAQVLNQQPNIIIPENAIQNTIQNFRILSPLFVFGDTLKVAFENDSNLIEFLYDSLQNAEDYHFTKAFSDTGIINIKVFSSTDTVFFYLHIYPKSIENCAVMPNNSCNFICNPEFCVYDNSLITHVGVSGQISYTQSWASSINTYGIQGFSPDLFSTLTTTSPSNVGIPENLEGYQPPCQFTESCALIGVDPPVYVYNYAGFRTYAEGYYPEISPYNTLDPREYLFQTLNYSMTEGSYKFTAYVSLSDRSTHATQIEVFFGNGLNYQSTNMSPLPYPLYINVNPQLTFLPSYTDNNGNVLTNKTEWVKLEGIINVPPNTIYNSIYIGNFRHDITTVLVQVPSVAPYDGVYWDNCYYYIDNVSVEPIVSPIAQDVFIPCGEEEFEIGPTPIDGFSYQWAPNTLPINDFSNSQVLFNNTNTGTNPEILNAILTATNTEGCTLTYNYTLTLAPQIDDFEILGTDFACQDDIYTISNFNDNVLYTWTITGGTPTTATGQSVHIQWENGMPGVITVTATYGNCKLKVIKRVKPCCIPENYDYIANGNPLTNNSSTMLSQIGSGSVINNKIIGINGIFTIDQFVNFQNCNIALGPDAQIILEPGVTLVINENSHLYACEEMWMGIYENDATSQVIIDNSIIEDAQYALISLNNSKFTVTNSTFNKNYFGVCAVAHNGNMGNPITGNRFMCGSFNNLGSAYLKPPHQNERSKIGVFLWNAPSASIKIGNSTAQGANKFENHSFGINCVNTNLEVENCHFRYSYDPNSPIFDIVANPSPGNQLPLGSTDIFVRNSVPAIGSINLRVGGHNPGEECTFEESGVGVFVYGKVRTDIVNNTIENSQFGFMVNKVPPPISGVYPPQLTPVNILKNKINLARFGIWCVEHSGSAILIDGNILKKIKSVGIYCANTSFVSKLPSLRILNNPTISGSNMGTGILVRSFPSPRIENNRVDFLGSFNIYTSGLLWRGIVLENALGNSSISFNTISRSNTDQFDLPPTGSDYENLRGIDCENSPGTLILCNQMNYTGVGLQLTGNNAKTRVQKNVFDHTVLGVKLNDAIMSNQGNYSSVPKTAYFNEWRNNYTSLDWGSRIQGHILGNLSNWTYSPYTTDLIPCDYGNDTPCDWSVTSTPLGLFSISHVDVSYFNCTDPLPNLVQYNELYDIWIDGDTLFNGQDSSGLRLLFRQNAMKDLEEDSVLWTMTDSVSQKYRDWANSLKLGFEGNIYDLENAYQNWDTTLVKTLHTNLPDSNLLFGLYKDLHQIYINTWMRDTIEIDSTMYEFLHNLAIGDPNKLGEVVYNARTMLGYYGFSGDSRMLHYHKNNKSAELNEKALIFPNPTSDQLQLKMPETFEGEVYFTIFDISGRSIKNVKLYIEKNNTGTIDLKELSSGIYGYKIACSNFKQTGKVVKL
jgi:hypothetical protein